MIKGKIRALEEEIKIINLLGEFKGETSEKQTRMRNEPTHIRE